MDRKIKRHCQLCHVKYSSNKEYIEHYSTVEHNVLLRHKYKNIKKDFCIFCQRSYDTIEEYGTHLKTRTHLKRLRVFRDALKNGKTMKELMAMKVIAKPPTLSMRNDQTSYGNVPTLNAMTSVSKATTSRIPTGSDQQKTTKQQVIDLRKLNPRHLAQLAIGPKSKQDELIVEKLIHEHANNTRLKEMAERLGPSMEKLVKEATASSVLKLLSEQGICSFDPSVDTLESSEEVLPTIVLTDAGVATNEQKSEQQLGVVTIKSEVADLATEIKVKQEPMVESDTNTYVNRMVAGLMTSARLLELNFQKDEIDSQLQVVDRQIAKCIDLRLYLLRKQHIINTEIQLTGTFVEQQPQQQPPNPNPYLLPSHHSASLQSTAAPELRIEENVSILENIETSLKNTNEVVLISDESDVEMLPKPSPKRKEKKKRVESSTDPIVILHDTPYSKETVKGIKTEVGNCLSPPVATESVAQTSTKPIEVEKTVFDNSDEQQTRNGQLSANVSLPSDVQSSLDNAARLLTAGSVKEDQKRKRTDQTMDDELKKRPKMAFVELSSVRRIDLGRHRCQVVMIKGYRGNIFSCSSDGTAKGFQLTSSQIPGSEKLQYNSIYIHKSNQVCGMELLPMKSSLFIIIANREGVLQKFDINMKWCFASANVRTEVTCIIIRWNVLFVGTARGEVHSFCAMRMTLRSSYHASQKSITCLGTGMEGACRLIYVGSKDDTVSVKDAFSGLLNRLIKLKSNHYPRNIQIVQDTMFTLAGSLGKQDIAKIYIHRLLDGQVLYLIENRIEYGIRCISVSENKLLVFSDCLGNLYRFDYDSAKAVKLDLGSKKGMTSALLIHNNMLITGTEQGHLEGWMDTGVLH